MNNQDQTQRDRQARDIFLRAIEIQSPEAQAAYLEGACRQDDSLRSRVEALLKSHKQDSFLETGPAERETIFINLTTISEGPGTVIGRYKLLQKLGEGGFGVVYMAEQKEPVKRRVALKIIKLGMDTKQVVARFEAERQALAMMDHPNIAKVFDAGMTESPHPASGLPLPSDGKGTGGEPSGHPLPSDGRGAGGEGPATHYGRPYFVMELVKGVPITKYCDDNQLTTKERLDLFIPVCQAVQHAHQKGIIHRDLKPSNIMITLHDGVPVPKVIDFGIAKATQQELTEKTIFTQYSQFIGTPAYMSPEQAEMSGLDIDTRSDIYSLGVVLYELLVGRTPLDAKELLSGGYDEIRRRIKEEEPAKPSTKASTFEGAEKTTVAKLRKLNPGQLSNELRGDLDWIVLKALEKDRTRRYETANGFALDLKRYLGNEPVAAVAPSPAYLLKKYVRRHRAALAVAMVIAVLLLLGITVSTWQAIRATRARRAVEEANRAERVQRVAAQTERDKAKAAEQAEKQERVRAEAEEAKAARLFYVANMNLAQQAWEQNDIRRLRQLLGDTQDSPYRGFEWYYWQPKTHLALKTLRGHLDVVTSVAFSPDGQRIVTGSGDRTARVWEAATGRELFALKGNRSAVSSVAFSRDGQRIVTGSHDYTTKVWDAGTGRELQTLKAHSEWTHNGWTHNGWINSLAFSPDGRRIVDGSQDKTAKVWEAATGQELLTLKGHSAMIMSVAFSPDSQKIATGSQDQTTKVWDTTSGRELLTLKGHSGWIGSVAFSPDGQRIVTGSEDNTAKVWDAVGGRELLTLKGHKGWIFSLAFSPDGQWIVTGSQDNTAKVWDAASGRELLTLNGHSEGIESVAFSPDGQRIVTGSEDKTVKVWNVPSGLSADKMDGNLLTLKGHSGWIVSVAFSPDGQRIATGSWDSTAKVWEVVNGRGLLILQGHSNAVSSLAYSPDGLRIVTGSADNTAKVWDAASGRELLTLFGHSNDITSVAFSPDGQRIVTGSSDNTATVWDAASGSQMSTLKGHTGWIVSVAFSPDGQRVATGSEDSTAKVWEAASGRELLTLKGHNGLIYSVAFSPDGQRIATGGKDYTAKVWEAGSGREMLTLKGHGGAIMSVAYSPDGQRIVTGSFDQTAKLWEAASGKELLTLRGHSDAIASVAFSPDGQRIATGSWDQTAKVWEGATAKQVTAWQEEEQAAADYLAVQQRERTAEQERKQVARARDSIKRWLVLAPIALGTNQNGGEGLDIEQINGEAQVNPRAGDAVSVGATEIKWQEVALTNEVLDFNALLEHETTQSVAYAVCYIRSDAEQHGLQMLVGSDDEAKVYLNGKEIYKSVAVRGLEAEQDEVRGVILNAGLNVLVFKVVNETAGWQGSIRFTDAQGKPVTGIKVTLDPSH